MQWFLENSLARAVLVILYFMYVFKQNIPVGFPECGCRGPSYLKSKRALSFTQQEILPNSNSKIPEGGMGVRILSRVGV